MVRTKAEKLSEIKGGKNFKKIMKKNKGGTDGRRENMRETRPSCSVQLDDQILTSILLNV